MCLVFFFTNRKLKKKYDIEYVLKAINDDHSICVVDVNDVYNVNNGETLISLYENPIDESTEDSWEIYIKVGNDKINFKYKDVQGIVRSLLRKKNVLETQKYILSKLKNKTIKDIELDDSGDESINIRTTTDEVFILQSVSGPYSSINV